MKRSGAENHKPPQKWSGQRIMQYQNGNPVENDSRKMACSLDTWNKDEEIGQCFGLGDVRKGIHSAEDCMAACCKDKFCGAWQFNTGKFSLKINYLRRSSNS